MAIELNLSKASSSSMSKPETGSNSLMERISNAWKNLFLGLSNDTLATAGSLNGTTSAIQATASAIDDKAGTSFAANSSETNTGVFTVGGGVNGLIFAIQNIFKGIFFAKEGASTGDSTRLGLGSSRIVRGTLDSLRNAANISKGAVMLSSGAEAFKDVLAKMSLGAAAGSAATGLMVCATGITMANEVISEAKEFESIVKDPKMTEDKKNAQAIAHLRSKLVVNDDDINKLKSEIKAESKDVLSRLARFAKEGFRYVFRDAKTEFVLLCRDAIRAGCLDPKTKAKLETLRKNINDNSPVSAEAYEGLNDLDAGKLEGYKNLYLKIESEQLQEKKTKLFDRVFGKEVRELLKNESKSDSEIVAKAKANVASSKRLFIALAVFAAIGTVASLTFAIFDYLETFTGIPIMKIVETSILLVTTLLMLGIDIAFLKSTVSKPDKANKIAAIGTLILSWATQTSLLITFKLSMIKAQILVPLSLAGAGMMYLIRKVAIADSEKKPEEQQNTLSDSGIGKSSEEAPLLFQEA